MSSLLQKLHLPGRLRPGTSARARFKAPKASAAMMVLGAIFIALLMGAVVGLGAMQLTVALSGMLLFLPLLFLINTRVLMPLLLVTVFVIQGTAESAFNMRLATWLATMLCGLFFIRAILELTNRRGSTPAPSRQFPGAGTVIAAASLYLLCYFFSLALGDATPIQILSTVRFTLPMFGVLFAFYWFNWQEERVTRLWWILVAITVLQVPVVVYQHFIMVSPLGWDAISGTFGSGMSAVLVLFALATLMFVMARWSRGLTSTSVLVGVTTCVLAVILLGEVKAALFWLPVGALWILRRRVLRNVVAFIMYSCLVLAFTASTYAAYKVMYWKAGAAHAETLSEKLDYISGYAIDPNNIDYRTGEVSRGATMMLWYRDSVSATKERLIGYGPGASASSSSTGFGVVAMRYRPLGIATTALAALLWDVGVVGALCYILFLVTGIVAGIRFVRRGTASPAMLSVVDASVGALGLLLTTVFYNRALLDEPTVQLLCFLSLGWIVQCCRYHDRSATPAAKSASSVAVPAVKTA